MLANFENGRTSVTRCNHTFGIFQVLLRLWIVAAATALPLLMSSCNESRSTGNAAASSSATTAKPPAGLSSDPTTITDVPALEASIGDLTESLISSPEDSASYYARGKACHELSQYKTGMHEYAIVMAALEDFSNAHDLLGGDVLLHPETHKPVSPAQLHDLPADSNGYLEMFPDVRRTPTGDYVRTDAEGNDRHVGGPGHIDALLSSSIIAIQLYNFPLADSYLQRATRIDPQNFQVRLLAAYLQGQQNNNWPQAAQSLQALTLEPEARRFPRTWSTLGNAYLQSGQPRKAENAFRKALGMQPKFRSAKVGLALALCKLRRFDEAIAVNKDVLADNPNNRIAANNLASALSYKQLFAEARTVCERLVKQAPTFPAAWMNLGAACQSLHDYEAALDAYRHARDLMPDYAVVYHRLGQVLHDAERYSEAEEHFQHALKLAPNYVPALYSLAANYVSMGECTKAVAAFQKYSKLVPHDGRVWQHLGYCSYKLQDYDASEKAYQRAVAFNPQDGYSLAGMGFVYEQKHDDKKAIDYHKLACFAGDTPSNALADYKRVAFRNGWFKMVADDMQQLAKSDTWRLEAIDLRTLADIALARDDDALADHTQLASLVEPEAQGALRFQMGVIRLFRGEQETAISELDAALAWDESNQYPALYKWMAQKQLGHDSKGRIALKKALKAVQKEDSIGRLLSFYLGSLNQADLIKAASSDSERCEAYFYIAQAALLANDQDKAAKWFKRCRETKAYDDLEYAYAHRYVSEGK